MELEQMPLMHAEYHAWRCVIGELIGVLEIEVDERINDERYIPLIRAIEHWGEELVPLRVSQGPDEAARIADEKDAEAERTRSDVCRDYLAKSGV